MGDQSFERRPTQGRKICNQTIVAGQIGKWHSPQWLKVLDLPTPGEGESFERHAREPGQVGDSTSKPRQPREWQAVHRGEIKMKTKAYELANLHSLQGRQVKGLPPVPRPAFQSS